MAAARRRRRQRNLNQIEIPEDNVTISDELLGKGGFGSVFIADYNGRNAAAKVLVRVTAAQRWTYEVFVVVLGENTPSFIYIPAPNS